MPLTESITNVLGIRTRAYLSDNIGSDVTLNVIESFNISRPATVTSHAIQNGANISDNVNVQNAKYNVSAILTDDDWDLLAISGFVNKTIDERIAIIESWQAVKLLLTYYGQDGDIDNVVISNLTEDKAKDIGAGYRLTFTLDKINVATAQTVEVTQQIGVTNKGKSSKGSKEKTNSPTKGKSKSILKSIAG